MAGEHILVADETQFVQEVCRAVLEEHGFDVVSLMDADVRGGDLASLDAIVMPHPDGRVYFKDDVQEILTGHSAGSMPDEYTGGIGLAEKGYDELDRLLDPAELTEGGIKH